MDILHKWMDIPGSHFFQDQGKTEIFLRQFFCSAPEVRLNITENPR